MRNLFIFLFIFGASIIIADAQIASGGVYAVEKSVVAGGGSASAGGDYKVEGTIGQNAAGTKQQNAAFTFHSGFWNAAPTFAPTAASVSVGRHILTADGRGIRNVLINLTDASAETRTVLSSAFGYYRFADVPAGATYIFSVRAKHYTFSQPTQVRSVVEDANDLNFIAVN